VRVTAWEDMGGNGMINVDKEFADWCQDMERAGKIDPYPRLLACRAFEAGYNVGLAKAKEDVLRRLKLALFD
jgi:hypothetical protein